MRFNKWVVLTSTSMMLALFVFCSNKKFGDNDGFLGSLMRMLSEAHYQPKANDDQLSGEIFTNVINNLDRDKHFFTQGDIDKLSVYKTSIDDQIQAGKFDFFDSTWTVLMKRLDQLDPMIQSSLAQPFNYQTDDSYTVYDDVVAFQPDWKTLEADWQKWLQFQSMERLSRKVEAQKKLKDSAGIAKQKPYDTLELQARNETKKFYVDWFKRLRKMDRRDQLSMYANAIAEIYDPHTNYFPPEDKENFDIQMSGKLEGIGARLQSDGEKTSVTEIVTGGPAWKQGALEVKDVIVKVAQGEGEALDVMGWEIDDVVSKIRGPKGTVVTLTVQKTDGTEKTIKITRDVVLMEEGFAKSLLLKGSETEQDKIGYIYLPKFYADFTPQGATSCAADVAK